MIYRLNYRKRRLFPGGSERESAGEGKKGKKCVKKCRKNVYFLCK